MIERQVTDWDDAYANGPHIAGGEAYPDRWAERAAAFRDRLAGQGRTKLGVAYGEGARNRYDLFLPEGTPKGLVVFIHGGFWLRFDNQSWSHLAAGPLAAGHAVAMPGYTLCPESRITGITKEIGKAIESVAARIQGPLFLTGHSAGGHLATRMISATSPLSEATRGRIANTVSISGVHDLRPMMKTAMNAKLNLDEDEARTESPALLEPLPGARLTCWVGAAERAEFVRQNALLANVWTGLGAATAVVEEPDRHHFDVIDGLADPRHLLSRRLLTV